MPILKVDIKILSLFFLISFSMVPNIEICLIYILDKNPKKQPQYNGGGGSVQWFQMSRNPPEILYLLQFTYFMKFHEYTFRNKTFRIIFISGKCKKNLIFKRFWLFLTTYPPTHVHLHFHLINVDKGLIFLDYLL